MAGEHQPVDGGIALPLGAITAASGAAAYWLRLTSEGQAVPKRQAFGAVGVAGVVGSAIALISYGMFSTPSYVSLSIGVLAALMGGSFWLTILGRVAERKLQAIAPAPAAEKSEDAT